MLEFQIRTVALPWTCFSSLSLRPDSGSSTAWSLWSLWNEPLPRIRCSVERTCAEERKQRERCVAKMNGKKTSGGRCIKNFSFSPICRLLSHPAWAQTPEGSRTCMRKSDVLNMKPVRDNYGSKCTNQDRKNHRANCSSVGKQCEGCDFAAHHPVDSGNAEHVTHVLPRRRMRTRRGMKEKRREKKRKKER